jgi:hypothetical protein
MKKADVHLGATYLVKVGGNLVPVKIDREHENGGWEGTSAKTGKAIRIKSPQRLRKRLADPEHLKAVHKADQENARLDEERTKAKDGRTASERAMAEPEPQAGAGKRMSCLDAAAKVLAETGEPMNTMAMFDAMVAGGYWSSDKATPQNTIYAAILREIANKGDASRFRRSEQRGKFELSN